MGIGDTIVIGVGTSNTLRNYASDLGFKLQRRYSVSVDKEARTYSIRREA